jgi:CheY-like chemotaxis protein
MATAEPKKAQTILVVEDEAAVRTLAIVGLESLGYRTLEAQNSAEALLLLEQSKDIDLVFTDVHMPGDMDGAELAFTVRSLWPTMGIVVVSGNFDVRVSRLPMGAGFLSKPYRLHTLETLIDQQFARCRARKAIQ